MDSIDAAELALSLPEVDPTHPSPARIYDFWLGGSQNFEADREAGRRAASSMPSLPASAQANRVFLRHVVQNLIAERGITQFLDLGSGVPTVGNVHEVAQAVDPDATVVYIDIDPVAIAHARALLADNPTAHAALADLREPDVVLDHPLVRDTIDWTKPVAILLFSVLHFIPDTEPTTARPDQIVHAFMHPCAPGSYLTISHGAPDAAAPQGQKDAARDYAKRTGVPVVPRTAKQITPWLTGLEIQPPGVADIRVWLPELDDTHKPIVPFIGVLARKP
ncbi:hypothetical protein ABH920_007640 [Catenulispora sp. EB89]|uniref:SAM-dependent methyltransferase n=1 Tax=Catenulispora sp. EB89 TaxID=3156257 RepID=UPI00351531BB